MFIEKSKAGFILTKMIDGQASSPRWGKVLAIGPNVQDFNVDDLVLIEPGMWTSGFEFEKNKYWKSDDTKVIAVSDDESVAYTTI